jgi:HEAT repeat protein
MEFLWSFEPLSALLKNNNSLVREWTVDRLAKLYPENAGDMTIDLISDEEEAVFLDAIDYFATSTDTKYARKLLEAYKTSSGMRAGMLANMIVRVKDARIIQTFQEKYLMKPKKDLTG